MWLVILKSQRPDVKQSGSIDALMDGAIVILQNEQHQGACSFGHDFLFAQLTAYLIFSYND